MTRRSPLGVPDGLLIRDLRFQYPAAARAVSAHKETAGRPRREARSDVKPGLGRDNGPRGGRAQAGGTWGGAWNVTIRYPDASVREHQRSYG